MFINLIKNQRDMLEQFYLPVTNVFLNIVSAIVIFVIALIIGKFAGMIVTSLFYELKIEEILETIGIKWFLSKTAGIIASLIIYVGGFIIAMNQLGIATYVIIIIAGFFLIIAALTLFLGATDTIRNLIAGMSRRKKYLSKKSINLPELKGKVVKVGYTSIKVRTKEKDIVVVPFIGLD